MRTKLQAAALAACAAALGLAGAPALARSPDASRYEGERAVCLHRLSNQDRATCLKEATNAYGEARRGALNNSGNANFSANAAERCKAQPPADQDACLQRIMGAGSTSGSVKEGGLLRETETRVK